MDDRNIILIDRNKDFSRHSVEEVHTFELNKWKNWSCSAGLRSIYIDFDGNVWRATCEEGGWLGNIFSITGIKELPQLTRQEWVTCTKNSCTCGADMTISKIKDISKLSDYFSGDGKLGDRTLGKEKESVDSFIVYSRENEEFKSVTWDLGRLCNFDCWYCSKNSHNNFDPVKNLKVFLSAYDNIKLWNHTNNRIKFKITGGEPTVYKDYLPFVKILKQDDHIVHTTTNGSNTENYYKELALYSDLAFSIHLAYVKRLGVEKFINNIKAAAEVTEQGHREQTDARYNWVIARIMLDPGNLEIAKETYDTIKKELSGYKNFVLTVDIVHVADENQIGKELYEYSEEEKEWLRQIHG